MQEHNSAVKTTMEAIKSALTNGTFETLIRIERMIQEAELDKYSKDPQMRDSILKTQRYLAEGMKEYRQLTRAPEAYFARGYRDADKTGPNKEFPLDTMRKELRSQATRVGNHARNPMLTEEEKEYHLLRVALLKRAERLYEDVQRDRLDGTFSL